MKLLAISVVADSVVLKGMGYTTLACFSIVRGSEGPPDDGEASQGGVPNPL